MAANLTTKTVDWSASNTETVVIDRKPATAVNGVFGASTIIYSGACDFQSSGGSEFINPAGAVDVSDGRMNIDGTVSVKVGDRATITQAGVATVYNVVNVGIYTFAPAHTELHLKRGPLTFSPNR